MVTHQHFDGFETSFSRHPTRDSVPFCMAPHVLGFIEDSLGGIVSDCLVHSITLTSPMTVHVPLQSTVREYNSSLVSWAVKMLSQEWSEPRLPIPEDMEAPCMRMVRVPVPLQGPRTQDYGKQLSVILFKQHKASCRVEVVAGELWCRFCAQVYNTREDYLCLASAMKELAQSPPDPQS